MKHSLKQKLLEYLQNNQGKHKKVDLYVLGDGWGYSPESIARILRILAQEGSIFVDYYDSKFSRNLARYSATYTSKKKQIVKEKDGKVSIEYVELPIEKLTIDC